MVTFTLLMFLNFKDTDLIRNDKIKFPFLKYVMIDCMYQLIHILLTFSFSTVIPDYLKCKAMVILHIIIRKE